MKILPTLSFLLLFYSFAAGQVTYRALVLDKKTGRPIAGATCAVDESLMGAMSDTAGLATITHLSPGACTIIFSHIGYEKLRRELVLVKGMPVDTVFLEPGEVDVEEMTVTSTRTENRVEDLPIRVEVLGRSEVKEEAAIKPGNIAKLLNETSGVQAQQTSLTSGATTFRLEGLPGEMTLMLKDGLPVYGGFLSGLSLLQTPPLDLEQVEIIKGPSSAMYGQGAVAGIVNLVSRRPGKHPEVSFIASQTQKQGTDLSGFMTGGTERFGYTVAATGSMQQGYDVDGDGFTDLPAYHRAGVAPRFFITAGDSVDLVAGLGGVVEDRKGGNLTAIRDDSTAYHVSNFSRRFNSDIAVHVRAGSSGTFTLKGGINLSHRAVSSPGASFEGTQRQAFGEATDLIHMGGHAVVFGLSGTHDEFDAMSSAFVPDYSVSTFGGFIHDEWPIANAVTLQSALRADYHSSGRFFTLPQMAILYKINQAFSVRASAGSGYDVPRLLIDREEQVNAPAVTVTPEMGPDISRGASIDLAYRGILFDECAATINESGFLIGVEGAPVFDSQSQRYANAPGTLLTRGLTTNMTLGFDELTVFFDYSILDVREQYDGNHFLPLTPARKLTLDLLYEAEGSWRTGMESFYTGSQFREDGRESGGYWQFGYMIEKTFGQWSIAGNVENIFDIRQSRYEQVVLPPVGSPVFRDLYAPLDGMVANVAVRFEVRE